jgi:hypothetical protein
VSRLDGKVIALCLELKEVHELINAQRAPIKEIDPCVNILRIQLGSNFSPRPIEYNMTEELEPPLESMITSLKLVPGRPSKASTFARNSYKYLSKMRAFEESRTKVGGGYG